VLVRDHGLPLHIFGGKVDGLARYGHKITSADSLSWSITARYDRPRSRLLRQLPRLRAALARPRARSRAQPAPRPPVPGLLSTATDLFSRNSRPSSKAELDAAAAHLDDLGISHEPIKDIGPAYILEFRDPDNIALELAAPK
jgi:hypothetical protein